MDSRDHTDPGDVDQDEQNHTSGSSENHSSHHSKHNYASPVVQSSAEYKQSQSHAQSTFEPSSDMWGSSAHGQAGENKKHTKLIIWSAVIIIVIIWTLVMDHQYASYQQQQQTTSPAQQTVPQSEVNGT